MKKPDLIRTVFQIALITAGAGAIAVYLLLLNLSGNASDLFIDASITFAVIFIACFFTGRYLISKYYYSELRDLYESIFQLSAEVKGVNVIPKKINDSQLKQELIRLVREFETSDKEEIVHLKELEVFRKEFLGNVSHELKTPIFTIQGYVHTLLDGGIEDQEINILYLQKASKSIDRLISIVDDLESISRLEAGELILEQRTFDINDLIHEVMESLELKAKESSVTLSLEKSAVNNNYVYADKERIRQVLVNLFVNSIKYGKRGGNTITLIEDRGDYFTVNVTDDGIGIDRQHLSRLFERFYRVDKSRSREQGGTGLGLAIVKHIIEAHRQKITVESSSGVGTTFTFTLKKSH